jgi:predicted aldo/keto reductase-like oxidoreductase
LFIRKGGAAEALEQARKQGKVRFVGFTGHKDPVPAGNRVPFLLANSLVFSFSG